MRYEFEVGDYVKLIANKTKSSKPIGYVGKVLRTKMFSGFGVCCALDSDDMSWSSFSDLAPATKAEYEAYHKPKPKFKVGDKVKLVGNSRASRFNIGDILSILEVDLGSDYICYRLGERNSFCPWTNESDLELYTEPQFKVGDWVTDDNARNVYKIGRIYNGKYYPSSSSWYTTQNGKLANTSLSFSWDLRLATEAEVKQHLLAEASRRG